MEQILEQVRGLTDDERAELLERLLVEWPWNGEVDDVGRRGLASWTEPTKNEDWSAYYPEPLHRNPGPHA